MPLANADSFRIPLRDESVHTIITSTPYFGLRQYDGVRPTVFGGRPDCEHIWTVTRHNPQPHGDDGMSGNLEGGRTTQAQTRTGEIKTAECSLCGAWRGYFGGETLHNCNAWANGEPPCGRCFVCHFRELAREMWRVLRDDGTVWIVIGDSYAAAFPCDRRNIIGNGSPDDKMQRKSRLIGALKNKDKMMIPECVRLALQADGWWVRSVSPWLKRNSMPESTTDRPSVAHEDIILLAKSKQYFFDSQAIRQSKPIRDGGPFSQTYAEHQPAHGAMDMRCNKQDGVGNRTYTGFNAQCKARDLSKTFARPSGKNTTLVIPGHAAPSHRADRDDEVPAGRNRRTTDWFFEGLDAMIEDAEGWLRYARSVRDKGGLLVDDDGNPLAFLVNPHGYKGSHYAVFPLALVTPMILASTSAYGVCPKCGAQWQRAIEKGLTAHDGDTESNYPKGTTANRLALLRQAARERGDEYTNQQKTIGWRPTCTCNVGGFDLKLDDLDIIESPVGKVDGAQDPTLETGRRGYNRPRRDDEGVAPMTRYQQRRYATQLRQSPRIDDMRAEAGSAFDHYIRTDASGARPIQPDLLHQWIERGWIEQVDAPEFIPFEPVPAIVLDPFVGSGTTVEAARQLGRIGIGFDISMQYLSDNALPRAERTNTNASMATLPLFADAQ